MGIDLENHTLPGPDPLDGLKYALDFNYLKAIGSLTSPANRRPDRNRAFLGRGLTRGLEPDRQHRYPAAQLDPWKSARILALVNFAISDGFIASFEAKYDFRFWRPSTAIQADDDGNPLTEQDADWRPLFSTPPLVSPPIPEYPSNHAVVGAAAAEVLARYFGDRTPFSTTSTSLPGVTRSFRDLLGCRGRKRDVARLCGDPFPARDHRRLRGGACHRTEGREAAPAGPLSGGRVQRNGEANLRQARKIRIPVHMIETINKLIRTSRALVQELGREPTSEEIAKRMDIPVSKVSKVLKIAQEPISLETPIGEEEDSHLGDFIEDRSAVSPAENVINLNLKEQTDALLKTLTPREERVIKMRFGIGDGSEHTLEEVGQSFQVTRERIRQIEAKALRKLRHPSRSRKLRRSWRAAGSDSF